MIVANLKGGMGNQCFIYAAGRALSLRYQMDLLLLTDSLGQANTRRKYQLDRFDIQATVDNSKKLESAFDEEDVVMLNGYFQGERYFQDCEAIIRREFTVIKIPGVLEGESVAIHVRRGDYAHDPTTKAYHGLLGMEYYEKAIAYMIERVPGARFYLFSDDPAWIKKHLPGTVISCGMMSDYEELCLMAQCKHQIIANSSFSWWGAWLNRNPQKIVVAPKQWFKSKDDNDIVPKEWVRL